MKQNKTLENEVGCVLPVVDTSIRNNNLSTDINNISLIITVIEKMGLIYHV